MLSPRAASTALSATRCRSLPLATDDDGHEDEEERVKDASPFAPLDDDDDEDDNNHGKQKVKGPAA